MLGDTLLKNKVNLMFLKKVIDICFFLDFDFYRIN
uniref:Uncharacterized protein n=1 Tax=Dulem virus 96 TaxID=3145807 RepID=A0AAU8B1G4_9VIRU